MSNTQGDCSIRSAAAVLAEPEKLLRARSRSRSREATRADAGHLLTLLCAETESREPTVSAPQTSSCRSRRPKDFHLRFTQIIAVKNFFDNLSMLQEVSLEVYNQPGQAGFKGILADSVDPSRVALVKGRLAASVEMNVANASFCIRIRNVLDSLSNAHPQHFLDIYREQGSTDVTLHVYDPALRNTIMRCDIKTLAKTSETLELDDMNYAYYVEIDLPTFRNAIKAARGHKADSIQLCIYEPNPSSLGRQRQSDDSAENFNFKTNWFVIQYKADEVSNCFPCQSRVAISNGQDGKGPVSIKAVASGSEEQEPFVEFPESEEELLVLYKGTFSAEYLYLFVKFMDRFNITLRLANGKPLIMDYPLGCATTDSLRYILAPQLSD